MDDTRKSFTSVVDILAQGGISRRGAKYEWQDHAVRLWKGIGMQGTPTPSWFKLFRQTHAVNQKHLLDATYASVADANITERADKYFYKVFYVKLKEGR